MKKRIVLILALLLLTGLAACGKKTTEKYDISGSPGTTSAPELTERESDSDDAETVTVSVSAPASASDFTSTSAAASASAGESTEKHIGYAYLSEEHDGDDILFEINEVVWINPYDEALMQQYGISYEDMTNDYYIVDEDPTTLLYRAQRDKTSFSILVPDPTYGFPANGEATADEFVDALKKEENQKMLVAYTLNEKEDPDDRVLDSISQEYVP